MRRRIKYDWRQDPRFQKECGCLCHTVPHWLYMDGLDRNRTREVVTHMQAALRRYELAPTFLTHQYLLMAIAAVPATDLPRVREKLATMRRLGIDHIPEELVALVEAETAPKKRSPEPEPPRPDEATLRGQLRSTALAMEMAATQAEKVRLRAELAELDAQMRHLKEGQSTRVD